MHHHRYFELSYGSKIADNHIAIALSNYMKEHIYDGEWNEIDFEYNIYKNWHLKEFFNLTGLSVADTRRIMKDSIRRYEFYKELEKCGIVVEEGTHGIKLYDSEKMDRKVEGRSKEILDKFVALVRREGSIRLNTLSASNVLHFISQSRTELANFFEKYEEEIKGAGIEIITDSKFEEIKLYRFIG